MCGRAVGEIELKDNALGYPAELIFRQHPFHRTKTY